MIRDKISQLIEDSAQRLGYTIYNSSVLLKGENSKIYVKIDSLTGISHDDCEKYSRELSGRLYDEDVLPNFTLEVSSPGITREIRNIDEFERFIDSPAKVVYEDGEERKTVKGIIKGIKKDTIEISVNNESICITYKDIVHANLDY